MNREQQHLPARVSVEEAHGYGVAFAKGRVVFPCVRDVPFDVIPHKLAAIVMAGAELGFSPFASLAGISIVEGKPRLGYQLLGALVRRSARYDYRVKRLDEEVAEIEFLERTIDGKTEILGVSSFTVDDAKTAGLLDPTSSGKRRDPWFKYRRNMLFARAMSNGVNFYCPDVASGCPVYADDGTKEGDEDIEATARVVTKPVEKTQTANATETTVKLLPSMKEPAKELDPVKIHAANMETKTAEAKPTEQAKAPDPPKTEAPVTTPVPSEPVAEGKAPRKRRTKAEMEAARAAEAPIATAMGIKPGDGPLAPDAPQVKTPELAPQETRPETKTTAPDAQDLPVDTSAEANPGLPPAAQPAFELRPEAEAADPEAGVPGKLATAAHQCGVNFFGSEQDGRSAWQAVGYTLPRKGEAVKQKPTGRQVVAYLNMIMEKAQERVASGAGTNERNDW